MPILSGSDRKDSEIPSTNVSFAGANFNVITNGESSIRYIWLHGDEKTAQMALSHHIKNYPGIAYFIQSEAREIPYKSTLIDPNRIFSRKGSYHALIKFKPEWAPGSIKASLDELDRERAQFFKELLPDGDGILIAVHNNFRGYNLQSEMYNNVKTSIKTKQSPRDFIICTFEGDFEKLSKGPYNVLFQNKIPERDDGSLSWAALNHNVRYVNIETRLGYLGKQKKMLAFIANTLK